LHPVRQILRAAPLRGVSMDEATVLENPLIYRAGDRIRVLFAAVCLVFVP